jgi:beta-lactam-binding protein with PASTA domain
MTFAWTWDGKSLGSRPDLLDVFRRFNGALPPWRCVVPSALGSTVRHARAAIAHARCVVGRVALRRSRRPAGLVVAQQPRPGARVPRWSPVNLTVSGGAGP